MTQKSSTALEHLTAQNVHKEITTTEHEEHSMEQSTQIDARQRALVRARKAKEAIADQERKERLEAAEKEARKWEERDRKVQRFLARKKAADSIIGASSIPNYA